MATLKDEQKLFIVQCLACYDTPTQVVEAVKDEFGLLLERPQIQSYDPTKVQGRDLSKKYREVFDATRRAFLEDISKIPIASQSFRLRSLQRMHDYAMSKKNYVMAASILEQAAKEVGNVYTNKHLLGNDKENPFAVWLQQIGGSSLPVVHDVDDSDVVTIDHEPQKPEKVKTSAAKPKKVLVERD
jgi:hypothetical protein